MSTFSGLSTALSSLMAQRQAFDVAGQNVANVNTVGYTRQRAALGAVPASTTPSMFSVPQGAGSGVRVTAIDRLGDVFLDTRVRVQTSQASYLDEVATGAARLEDTLGEPGSDGLAAQLGDFWPAWNDVANTPDKASARAVLVESARGVATRLGTLHDAVQTQWSQARDTAVALVDDVNARAANVADLNARIQQITGSGGSANELLDERDLQLTALADLVGARVQRRDDGQVDVLIGGSPLVAGTTVRRLTVTGATTFAQATTAGGADVRVAWESRPDGTAGLDGGRVAGLLALLAPADGTGTGGLLAETAGKFDGVAQSLADQVNGILGAGNAMFAVDPASGSAAKGLSVVATPDGLVVASADEGPRGGSLAARVAALGTAGDGPGARWDAVVVDLGVKTSAAASRAAVSEVARASAEQQQVAQASVDVDQESIDLLAIQRAYEGSARVLTAIDEMLDVLINRTGVVGR